MLKSRVSKPGQRGPGLCRSLLALFLLTLAAQAGAHEDGAYRHETSDLPAMGAWMAGIDGDRTIRSLSLPGTHGSAALHGGHIAANQTLSVTQQLNGGVRVLDLRLRHIDNVFALHHGPVFQRKFFGDALNEIQAFLQANPSETVFMRVKEEHKPENTTRSFEDTFAAYFDNYRRIIAVPGSGMRTRLSELRGKLVFLVDFRAGRSFGLGYGSFDIQDEFSVSSNWDVYRKWQRVKDHFARSTASSTQAPASINYLSASGGSFPYFVASGHVSAKTNANRLSTGRIARKGNLSVYPDFPRVSCLPRRCTIAFEGTNILARDFIRKERPAYVGFVLADFPGPDLIKAVAEVNFQGAAP
ncbi:phosphatidylinositol-specific phospholipase C [Lysobacter sp. S4-A87]|uniref:phosphatidylinositol-specific phospholipase C n=1 Tax=Lysobacter sp. S4-A87 TaxID=2925843 RepID=UPI001F536300|nr:phosphatidylinositol-specific phospholipase C [Lysobacter sp. S4-A87]UNK48995.1 phosphatidylinositol-specific phospholipase C [Lysobacter sp. S4-A87]